MWGISLTIVFKQRLKIGCWGTEQKVESRKENGEELNIKNGEKYNKNVKLRKEWGVKKVEFRKYEVVSIL